MTYASLAALVAALCACNGKATPASTAEPGSGSATPGSASAPVTAPVIAPVIAPVTGPTVRTLSPTRIAITEPPVPLPRQEAFTLVDAGKGAKSALRYAPATTAFEYRTELVLTTRELHGVGYGDPVTLPPIREGFAITPSAVTNGAITLALRALDAQIVGTSTPAAEAYVAAAKGNVGARRATVTIDPRGQLRTIAFNDDPTNQHGVTAQDEVAQRLLAEMVPLPSEPIGIGASWRVSTILRLGPLYVKQTATYQLMAKTGTTLTVHAAIRRTGEQQLVTDEALPPHTVAELIALVRNLNGDLTVDLAHPLATAGTLALDSMLHARLTTEGEVPVEQLVEDSGTIVISSGASP